MSKYHSKKIEADGIIFDSRKEYRRWVELSLLEKAGEISELRRQVKFVLIPAQYELVGFTKTGKSTYRCFERECSYVADFVYKDDQGVEHVEDTKGFKTKDYIIKRKLMSHLLNLRIEEI